MPDTDQLIQHVAHLIETGVALSAEKDTQALLERIVESAQALTHADGGTLYLVKDDALHFAVMRTDSHTSPTKEGGPPPPIPLHLDQGVPNTNTMASCTAVSGITINIANLDEVPEFDFSGALKYEAETGYHSRSFLAIPLVNHEHDVIGVLQLINAQDPETGEIIPFSKQAQRAAESLASQAAMALTNRQLLDGLRELLEKFIEMIADAIDEKSPYTGGHCRRVPEIAMLLADAINATDEGAHKHTFFTEAELYELKIAALMHDCGKITTPVHIVDKATKLETIFDRIELVQSRFELLKKDLEIALLKQRLAQRGEADFDARSDPTFQAEIARLDEEFAFLRKCNLGSEFMSAEDQARVAQIGQRQWRDSQGHDQPLLTENEHDNLIITKGTLTEDERLQINAHIVTTLRMLESLPFPKHLRNVPEIAGGHHERMDGKGYPKGLTGEEMSVQARLMGIADIFEALTAADRPYKKAMPLSQALNILANMAQEGHIDPELFHVFIKEKVYLRYAERFLTPEQLDEVDPQRYLTEASNALHQAANRQRAAAPPARRSARAG